MSFVYTSMHSRIPLWRKTRRFDFASLCDTNKLEAAETYPFAVPSREHFEVWDVCEIGDPVTTFELASLILHLCAQICLPRGWRSIFHPRCPVFLQLFGAAGYVFCYEGEYCLDWEWL